MSKHTALRFSFDISVEAFRAKLDAEADRIARELGVRRKAGPSPADMPKKKRRAK